MVMMEGFRECEKCGDIIADIYPHYDSDCKKRREVNKDGL